MIFEPDPRRATFEEDAARYERARPGYPPAVFADLADLARLEPGSPVLEIGCGTGQASVPLAERGFRLTAVELGPQLAAIARRKLAPFPATEVVVADFEQWSLPAVPFDAVVAATAFHWLDPAHRATKAAAALRVGGTLATIATHHVAGGTTAFFVEVQSCYERWMPGTPPGLRLPAADSIPPDEAELVRSGQFGPATFCRYAWEQVYPTAAYLDLLQTYSDHRRLAPSARQALLRCIGRLIDTRYGGRITKRYVTELRVAQRAR